MCFTGFKRLSKPIPSHGYAQCITRLSYATTSCCAQNGDWDDVSGETFLRKLLAMSPDQAKFNTVRFVMRCRDPCKHLLHVQGRDSLYDCTGSITVDPRQLAQRVMEVRADCC